MLRQEEQESQNKFRAMEGNGNDVMYACNMGGCNQEFSSLGAFHQHRLDEHMKKPIATKQLIQTGASNGKQSFKIIFDKQNAALCPVPDCEVWITRIPSLIQHVKVRHQMSLHLQFACPACVESFNTRESAFHHVKAKHKDINGIIEKWKTQPMNISYTLSNAKPVGIPIRKLEPNSAAASAAAAAEASLRRISQKELHAKLANVQESIRKRQAYPTSEAESEKRFCKPVVVVGDRSSDACGDSPSPNSVASLESAAKPSSGNIFDSFAFAVSDSSSLGRNRGTSAGSSSNTPTPPPISSVPNMSKAASIGAKASGDKKGATVAAQSNEALMAKFALGFNRLLSPPSRGASPGASASTTSSPTATIASPVPILTDGIISNSKSAAAEKLLPGDRSESSAAVLSESGLEAERSDSSMSGGFVLPPRSAKKTIQAPRERPSSERCSSRANDSGSSASNHVDSDANVGGKDSAATVQRELVEQLSVASINDVAMLSAEVSSSGAAAITPANDGAAKEAKKIIRTPKGPIDVFKCLYCPFESACKEAWKTHRAHHSARPTANSSTCEFCSFTDAAGNATDMLLHKLSHFSQQRPGALWVDPSVVRTLPEAEMLWSFGGDPNIPLDRICPYCDRVFETPAEMNEHSRHHVAYLQPLPN